jgi:hypothetical protein
MTGLARSAGADVEAPRKKRAHIRAFEAVAIENAVEGCVHETFGAAVALVQAETARDRVRRARDRAVEDLVRCTSAHPTPGWSQSSGCGLRRGRSAS